MTAPARKPSFAAALLIAALALGALACAWQAVRANSALAAEREARQREAAHREEAELEARVAQDQNLEAQLVLTFFQTEVLTAKSLAGVQSFNITLGEALDRAEPVIAREFSARPLLEAAVRSAMSVSYRHLNQFDAAISQLQRAVELRKQALGPTHPATLSLLNNLGVTYQRAGRHETALRLLEETLQLKTTVLGPNHNDTIIGANNLALAYCHTRSPEKAVALLESALQQPWARENSIHPDTLTCMYTLSQAYQRLKRFDQAIPLLENMLRLQREAAGPLDFASLRITDSLVGALYAAGELDKAEALCQELCGLLESRYGPDHTDVVLSRIALSLNLIEQSRHAEAEAILRACLATLHRKEPDSWLIFSAQALLGAALVGQARDELSTDTAAAETKFAAAEPLLTRGYAGLKSRSQDIPKDSHLRLAEALQRRLIDLYTAWNKPEQAAKWQAEFDAKETGNRRQTTDN